MVIQLCLIRTRMTLEQLNVHGRPRRNIGIIIEKKSENGVEFMIRNVIGNVETIKENMFWNVNTPSNSQLWLFILRVNLNVLVVEKQLLNF